MDKIEGLDRAGKIFLSKLWLFWVFTSAFIISTLYFSENLVMHKNENAYCSADFKIGIECGDFLTEFVIKVNYFLLVIVSLIADFLPAETFMIFFMSGLFLILTCGYAILVILKNKKEKNDQN